MIQLLTGKFMLPIIGAIMMGFGGYAAGVYQVSNRPIEITSTPIIPACPSCPSCPPTLGSELEKVKGKYVTVNLNQALTIQMESDTTILKAIGNEVESRINKLRVVKCK